MKNQNNKLLAEFLKIQVQTDGITYFDKDYKAIPKYQEDWNQLMKVAHAIRNTDVCTDFNININGDCKIKCHFDMEFETYCDNKINTQLAVYYCCVSFVKWYNENINGKNFN